MAERRQLGQQRLGAPVMTAFEALIEAVDANSWSDFRREPVRYYFDRMIGAWLLRLMDSALSDEQLAAVPASQVYRVVVLLFRDMFRHNSDVLRPESADASWVEPLFEVVSARLGLAVQVMQDNVAPYELDDMGNCEWARSLSAPFGMVPQKLFACHSAVVTGAREALSGGG
jgi:hypothetical protein